MNLLTPRRVIKARNIMRDWRIDARRTLQDLEEALERGYQGKPGGINPSDFSIRDLAEECIMTHSGERCGYEFVKDYMNPGRPVDIQEAISAVDSTAFRNITGQLLVRAVLESFRTPTFVLSNLIPSNPTPFTKGEKLPGISLPKDPENDDADWMVLGEAEEYKSLGFGEEYIQLPATEKRGAIIPVTREAIFEDLTGLIIRRAQYVGTMLGMRKEKRLTDILIGYTNNYQEKRANDSTLTARNTYYRNFGSVTTEPWINHLDGNELDDWTALDAADNLFTEMTDPNTGEPIMITGRTLIHCPQKRSTVARILNATEIRETSNTNNVTISANVVRPGITAIESTWVYSQLKARFGLTGSDAAEYWFYGDVARAFAYQENWPITVLQAPANSEAEFTQDVVLRFKATERGKETVMEPRLVTRHRKTASLSSSGS